MKKKDIEDGAKEESPIWDMKFENRVVKLDYSKIKKVNFKDIIQCTSCEHSKEGCSKGHWLGSPMEVEGNENWDNCKDFKEK